MSKKELLKRIVELERVMQGRTEYIYSFGMCITEKKTQGALSKIESLQEEVASIKLDIFRIIEYLGIKKEVKPATVQEVKYVKVKKKK